jgi:hypothetical protein
MMPKYHYKVVVNRGWVGWWGLMSDYEKETQKVVDHWNSRGWDLHSFSLRNGMMPNVSILAIMVRLIIRMVTLGFMVYEYGGVWVFKKELKESVSCMNSEPTL